MKKLACVGALWLGACSPSIPDNAAPTTITAEFDLSVSPPVAPAPNDLARGPDGGDLQIPINQLSSPIDNAVVQYLDTLPAYPPDSSATAKFSASLKPTSVNANTVVVYDLTAGQAIAVAPSYQDNTDQFGVTTGELVVNPPAGVWPPGDTIAVALIAGSGGLVGKNGEPVVGSASWALVSATSPLVDCSSGNCEPTTALISSGAQAEALEQIRLGYQSVLQTLAGSDGVDTSSVVLMWTFTTLPNPILLFSPATSQVPLPNDLAIVNGVVNAPVDPTSSPAQQEWTSNYLNTLNGFPVLSPGSQAVIDGDLDPTTVNASTVQVVDLTAAAEGENPSPAVTIAYDSTAHQIDVLPPAPTPSATGVGPPSPAGWIKGHQYAVLVLAGPGGVAGPNGEQVIASSPEVLVTGQNSLVNCPGPSLDPSTCTPTFDLTPMTSSQAVQLEEIRLGYTAVLDELFPPAGPPVGAVGAFWTFTIMSNPELVFNLDATQGDLAMPFPNFALFNPATGTVNFPIADGGNPQQNALLEGLNTLDGFSTSAPIVAKYDFSFSETPDLDVPGATLDATSFAAPGAACTSPICTTASDGDGGGVILNLAVGLIDLIPDAGQPVFNVCLNCTSTGGPDGGEPEQLQIVPQVPLDERSDYVGYVTTSVLTHSPIAAAGADGGIPEVSLAPSFLFSFLRLSNPLVDAQGNTTMPAELTSSQAAQLEPLRLAMSQALGPIEAGGIPESSLALAWAFHTQTEISQLDQLTQFAAATPIPSTPNYAVDVSSVILSTTNIQANPFLAPIGKVFEVSYYSPLLLNLSTGAFYSNPADATPTKIGAFLSFPKTPANGGPPVPPNGYPVLIFGHGVTRSNFDALALMGAASEAGYAVIAADTVWHGERSTCAGVAAGTQGLYGASDDDACTTPVSSTDVSGGPGHCDEGINPDGGIGGFASPTYGRCVSLPGVAPATCNPSSVVADLLCFNQGQGGCVAETATTGHCEGGDLLRTGGEGSDPVISGWNMLNVANFFATRDNFRQQNIDLGQLVRVLKDTSATGLNAMVKSSGGLDATDINYTGMSLGGILGTNFVATSPDIHRVVLDVPGAKLSEILLTSPAFQPLAQGLEAALAAQGLTVGSLGFDYFINTAQWVVDPADPINTAYYAAGQSFWPAQVPQPADRQILVQYIQNDQVVPNSATLNLLNAANRNGVTIMPSNFYMTPECPAGTTASNTTCILDSDRHGFIIDFADQALTTEAQGQLMGFIATGTFTQIPQ